MRIEPLDRFPKSADDCRGRAEILRKAAADAASPTQRVLFLRFAEEWEVVAEEFEAAAGHPPLLN